MTKKVEDLIPVVIESLDWKFSETDEVLSPILTFLVKENEDTSNNKKWFVETYLPGTGNTKEPTSQQAFWMLLIHLIASGNPSGGDVASALSYAFGLSKQTVWNHNRSTVQSLFSKNVDCANSVCTSLRFKYDPRDCGSESSLSTYIKIETKKKNKGFLYDSFFPSAGKKRTPEKCRILLLLCAACCGHPRVGFYNLIARAWGVSRNTLSSHITFAFPSACEPQVNEMTGTTGRLKRKKGGTSIPSCRSNTISENTTLCCTRGLPTTTLQKQLFNSPDKKTCDTAVATPVRSPFLSPEQPPKQKPRYKSPAIGLLGSMSSVVSRIFPSYNDEPFSDLVTSVSAAITSMTPHKRRPESTLEGNTESATCDDNESIVSLTDRAGNLSIGVSDQHVQSLSLALSPTVLPRTTTTVFVQTENDWWTENPDTGLLERWMSNKLGIVKRVGTAVPVQKASKSASGVGQRQIRKRRDNILQFIDLQGEDDDNTLLRAVASQRGFRLEPVENNVSDDDKEAKHCFTIEEAYAQMSLLNITGNKMNQIDQFHRIYKGWRHYPVNFRKQLAAFEKLDSLAIKPGRLTLLTKKGESGKPDEYKPCDWFCLEAPHRVVEMVVSACFIAGKFLPTAELSTHSNKSLIFPFGCDKGGPSTNMLIRLGNRQDGNGKNFCAIIASMSGGAAECYDNLKRTIYKPGSRHLRFLQDLVLDKLFAFVVYIGGEQNEAENVLVFVVKLFKDDLSGYDYYKVQREQTVYLTICSHELPEDIRLLPDDSFGADPVQFSLEKSTQPNFIVRPIKSNDNKHYAGFTARCGTAQKGFRFNEKILATSSISFECFQLLGFPAHDTKHGWLCGGHAESASCAKNCLICTADRLAEQKVPLQWIRDFVKINKDVRDLLKDQDGASIYSSTEKDAPLREGENSNEKSYQKFQKETGDGTYKFSKTAMTKINRKCQGIIREPLLYIPPAKDPLAPMHTPHGIVSHFLKNVRSQLRSLDETTTWPIEVEIVLADVKAILAIKTNKNSKAQFDMYSKRIRDAEMGLRLAIERKVPQPIVDKKRQLVATLQESRKTYGDSSNIVQHNRLVKAAEKLKAAIESAQQDNSRLPRGPGEYAFNQALPLFGRASYMKHFGGGLLSHTDSINVLQHWDGVAASIEASYSRLDANLQASMKKIVTDSKKMAGPLFQVCRLLKSQKKILHPLQSEINEVIGTVCVLWTTVYPKQEIFPKLHHLQHVPRFIASHGMYGLLSEEGFESIHPLVNKVMDDLAPMMDSETMQQSLANRVHKSLNPAIEKIKMEYEVKKKGRYHDRPKKYSTTGRSRNDDSGEVEFQELAGDVSGQYYELEGSEGIIKKSWKDVYELMCCSRAPDAWSRVFTERDDLGRRKKEELKYMYS